MKITKGKRMKVPAKKILIVLGLIFIGVPVIAAHAQNSSSQINEAKMPKQKLINLFHQARQSSAGKPGGDNIVISGEVEQYIKSCCEDRDAAIELLRENGFKIYIASDPDKVSTLNQHWKTTDENYDEFISGKRGVGYKRFWDFMTQYDIALFMKAGKVGRVWARTNTVYP